MPIFVIFPKILEMDPIRTPILSNLHKRVELLSFLTSIMSVTHTHRRVEI